MSTENNENRGSNSRFVWGIVAVVIVCGILYGGYLKNKDLNEQLTTLKEQTAEKVSKSKYDTENGLHAKAIQAAEDKLKNAEDKIAELEGSLKKIIDEKKAKEEADSHDLSIPGKFAGERKTVVIEGVEFAFRWCPAGTYTSGSPKSEEGRESDETQHEVTLSNGFWMLETEVTLGMFKAFVSDTGYESKGDTPYGWTGNEWKQDPNYSWRNPGFSQDDNHPVTCVSWDDAVAFCKWLSKKTGQNITLPTEAQWEYACRAGTTGAYAGNLDDMAWYNGNSGTHPVGTKKPNAWDLYDMHGNVWEWCLDGYGDYSSGSVTDPAGPSSGSYRVYRGGGWDSRAQSCRSAYRRYYEPGRRINNLGFRVLRGQ